MKPATDKMSLHSADRIMSKPELYSVCHGCGSIVTAATVACPSCLGYNFDRNPERVKAQAQTIVTRERQSVQPEDLK